MPTGYTADITSNTSFEDFAVKCARAFGALVDMRDAPLDAQIPDNLSPDGYYPRRVQETEKELEQFKSADDDSLKRLYLKERKRRMEEVVEGLRKMRNQRAAYERMLVMVDSWTPPSRDHVGMKKFMQEQLKTSIDFDCSHEDYYLKRDLFPPFYKWKKSRLRELRQSLKYAKDSLKKEEKTYAKRNVWIKKLRDSLRST
jgi:hypothetical protein